MTEGQCGLFISIHRTFKSLKFIQTAIFMDEKQAFFNLTVLLYFTLFMHFTFKHTKNILNNSEINNDQYRIFLCSTLKKIFFTFFIKLLIIFLIYYLINHQKLNMCSKYYWLIVNFKKKIV